MKPRRQIMAYPYRQYWFGGRGGGGGNPPAPSGGRRDVKTSFKSTMVDALRRATVTEALHVDWFSGKTITPRKILVLFLLVHILFGFQFQ